MYSLEIEEIIKNRIIQIINGHMALQKRQGKVRLFVILEVQSLEKRKKANELYWNGSRGTGMDLLEVLQIIFGTELHV